MITLFCWSGVVSRAQLWLTYDNAVLLVRCGVRGLHLHLHHHPHPGDHALLSGGLEMPFKPKSMYNKYVLKEECPKLLPPNLVLLN